MMTTSPFVRVIYLNISNTVTRFIFAPGYLGAAALLSLWRRAQLASYAQYLHERKPVSFSSWAVKKQSPYYPIGNRARQELTNRSKAYLNHAYRDEELLFSNEI